jgi:ABC-type hemin transport system ATPase subunit
MTAPGSYTEEIKVTGGKLLETVKNVVRAGNVRRVVVRNAAGRTVLDVPLTAGLAGAVLLPAVGRARRAGGARRALHRRSSSATPGTGLAPSLR